MKVFCKFLFVLILLYNVKYTKSKSKDDLDSESNQIEFLKQNNKELYNFGLTKNLELEKINLLSLVFLLVIIMCIFISAYRKPLVINFFYQYFFYEEELNKKEGYNIFFSNYFKDSLIQKIVVIDLKVAKNKRTIELYNFYLEDDNFKKFIIKGIKIKKFIVLDIYFIVYMFILILSASYVFSTIEYNVYSFIFSLFSSSIFKFANLAILFTTKFIPILILFIFFSHVLENINCYKYMSAAISNEKFDSLGSDIDII